MGDFFLSTSEDTNVTLVSNVFIDEYMVDANGEYVKIYIYLLRCLSQAKNRLSFHDLSARMDLTIKEIKRAMQYWQSKGLLNLEVNEHDEINKVVLSTHRCSKASGNASSYICEEVETENQIEVEPFSERDWNGFNRENSRNNVQSFHSYISGKQAAYLLEQDDIKMLMYVAQQYLGRTLNNTDIQTILFIYDRLNFGTELIEHLLAYCVSNKHSSMKYIEKVALDWAAKGVVDVDSAKMAVNNYCKEYYDILKALGIRGRAAIPEEIGFMKKWLKDWGFSVDIVIKACEKTMMTASKPSFNYVNSILDKWKACKVSTLKDIEVLDEEFKNNKRKRRVSGLSFDFDRKDYNYQQIEIDLLNS